MEFRVFSSALTLPQALTAPRTFFEWGERERVTIASTVFATLGVFGIVHAAELFPALRGAGPDALRFSLIYLLLPMCAYVLHLLVASFCIALCLRWATLRAPKFSSVIWIVAGCSMITLLQDAVQAAAKNWVTGGLPGHTLGANLLFAHSPLIANLAAIVNPFTFWFAALLVFGIARITKVAPGAAIIALAPYFVACACLHVMISVFATLHNIWI